jgi:hypothetical protein
MIKTSQLLKNIQDYMEFYGDQNVTIHYSGGGEDLEIVDFDAFKNEFSITIDDFEDEDEDDE